MPTSDKARLETHAVRYAFDLNINASPAKVWELLTHNISVWWPSHFNSDPGTERFVLEPTVGGRMYEDTGNGSGVLWGNVVVVSPEKRLVIRGSMFPDYGGPGEFFLSIEIEPRADGCKLTIDDAQFGVISTEGLESTEAGWKELFGELKRFAEAS